MRKAKLVGTSALPATLKYDALLVRKVGRWPRSDCEGGLAMDDFYRLKAVAAVALLAAPAFAAETVTYTYDAKGRLVKVVRSGGPSNGVQTDYQHDKADNRKRVTTTGSSNPPQP